MKEKALLNVLIFCLRWNDKALPSLNNNCHSCAGRNPQDVMKEKALLNVLIFKKYTRKFKPA